MSGTDLVVLPGGQQYQRADVPAGYDADSLPTLDEWLGRTKPAPTPKPSKSSKSG